MDILILKEKYGSQILSGNKSWELRNNNTKKRGKIFIAYSKTGKIFGEVELYDTLKLTKEIFDNNIDKHLSEGSWETLLARYKNPYAWLLKEPILYDVSIPYKHPKGAIIWVKGDQSLSLMKIVFSPKFKYYSYSEHIEKIQKRVKVGK